MLELAVIQVLWDVLAQDQNRTTLPLPQTVHLLEAAVQYATQDQAEAGLIVEIIDQHVQPKAQDLLIHHLHNHHLVVAVVEQAVALVEVALLVVAEADQLEVEVDSP